MSLNYILFRHGISRTDFNLLSDAELSFMEFISKMPSNPATMNKGTVGGNVLNVALNLSKHSA